MPPPWMLPLFAVVILALVAAIEALLAPDKRVSEVWVWHVIIWGCAGFILTLPIAYHAYIYRGKAMREMQRAKKSLEAYIDYLTHIADSLPVGIIVFDAKKIIAFQNRVHRSWFGDWTGKSCEEFFKVMMNRGPPDVASKEKIRRVTIKDMIFDIETAEFKMPDTEESMALVTFSDLTSLEGARIRLSEMEEKIARTDKLATLGQLVAGVAHEVNTPLTNIALTAELLERRISSEEEKKRLRVIRDQVDAAAKTVHDLLLYVRGVSDFEVVEVNPLVEETIWFISQKRLSSISLKKSLTPSEPRVHGIRNQLQQVLVNLLSNAYDATEEGGEIIVTTDIADDDVVISVKDTGKGIAPEDLKKIFQPFFTTKKESGTGLGLTIAKDIVERHGGRIEVESQPGKGSTFRVILPRIK